MSKELSAVQSPTVKKDTQIKWLDPKKLHTSENPRQRMSRTGLDELKESIRAVGILSPILCYENNKTQVTIISGHRRAAAAIALKMETVPVIYIKTDSDRAAEAAIIENIQREDLEPLDEAYAMNDIKTNRKLSVTELSLRCGKSDTYVYRRLRLLDLPDLAKQALRNGELSLEGAILMLRIQGKELLRQAAKFLFTGSRRADIDDIQRCVDSYTNQLSKAPFSIKDALLFSRAGACTDCPKRSSTQSRLFDDVEKKDHCLDATCWREKVKRHGDHQIKVLSEKGAKVIKTTPKGAYKNQDGSISIYSSGFIDLEGTCDNDPKYRKYKALLGKGLDPKDLTLYQEKSGNLRVLMDKEKAHRKIKANGINLHSYGGSSSTSGKKTPAQKVARSKAILRAKAKTRALDEAKKKIMQLLRKGSGILNHVKALGIMVPVTTDRKSVDTFAKSRELKKTRQQYGADFQPSVQVHIQALGNRNGLSDLVELLLLHITPNEWGMNQDHFNKMLKLFKIDFKKLQAQAEKDIQAEKAKKKSKPKAKKKKSKKAKAKRSKPKAKK